MLSILKRSLKFWLSMLPTTKNALQVTYFI